MASLVFDKCCCCIDLKTGCFIIGYINLIAALLGTFWLICAVIGVGMATAIAVGNDQIQDEQKEAFLVAGVSSTVVLFIELALFGLGLVFVIVLLVGLHSNKPGHLNAYLIYSMFSIVIFIIIFTIQCLEHNLTLDSLDTVISILLEIYSYLVMRSMFYKMKNPTQGPIIYSGNTSNYPNLPAYTNNHSGNTSNYPNLPAYTNNHSGNTSNYPNLPAYANNHSTNTPNYPNLPAYTSNQQADYLYKS